MQVRDHVQAVAALTAFEADLALVLQPPPSADLHVLYSCRQPLCALMRAGHPLDREAGPVRLRDCLAHTMALPDRSLAIRLHLEQALARRGRAARGRWSSSSSLEFLRNLVLREEAVSLQVPSGIPDDPRLASRPIDARDLDPDGDDPRSSCAGACSPSRRRSSQTSSPTASTGGRQAPEVRERNRARRLLPSVPTPGQRPP